MAIRIKKKKPEGAGDDILDQPDQVLAATQETFGWLQDNRNLVLGLIGGGIAAIVVGSLIWDAGRDRAVRDSEPVLHAVAVAGTPIGVEDGQFASSAERAAAVAEAAGAASDNPVARLVEARARLELGEAGPAEAAYADAAAGLGSVEQGIVAFGTAGAQAESGDLEGALATLEHAGVANEGFAPAASLQAARLVDAFGTPEAALAAYREHLDAYPAAPARAMVENRVAQLEIALDAAPAPETAAADDVAENDEAPAAEGVPTGE